MKVESWHRRATSHQSGPKLLFPVLRGIQSASPGKGDVGNRAWGRGLVNGAGFVHSSCMGKTITLSDAAYTRLAKHKRAGESFSDVVVDMIPDADWQKEMDRLWLANPYRKTRRAKTR